MGLTSVVVCGVVPVAAIMPVLLAGAYRQYRGAATTCKYEYKTVLTFPGRVVYTYIAPGVSYALHARRVVVHSVQSISTTIYSNTPYCALQYITHAIHNSFLRYKECLGMNKDTESVLTFPDRET